MTSSTTSLLACLGPPSLCQVAGCTTNRHQIFSRRLLLTKTVIRLWTETEILRKNASEIAAFIRPAATLIEYGAEAGLEIHLILSALKEPRCYVPVDNAKEYLCDSTISIGCRFPTLTVHPIATDFASNFELPLEVPVRNRTGVFLGSMIGNFDDAKLGAFLGQMRRHVGDAGRAIIGVDFLKDVHTILKTYDDARGITGKFNLNILARINRELHGDFRLDRFRHEARWNELQRAVEIHLVSREQQQVRVDGRTFLFDEDNSIHTNTSRKFDKESFEPLSLRAGWEIEKLWSDDRKYFGVFGLVAAAQK